MYCSSKLHNLYVLPIPVSACQPTFFACSHGFRSYCHFQFTVLEVIFLDPDVSFRGLGCRNPGGLVCAQKQKECGFLLSDSCSRRHFLRPVGSSLLADVCIHFTLCFFLLIALEAMFFGLKACVSWETQFPVGRNLTKQLSLLYPVHTRLSSLGLVLGHAPRAISCARHDGIFFSLSFQKVFVRHGSQHALAEETVYKAFTQLAREAYRCVPVRA